LKSESGLSPHGYSALGLVTLTLGAQVAHAAPGDLDNDGIPDVVESDADANNDGVADGTTVEINFLTEDFGTGTSRASTPYTSYTFQGGSDVVQDGEYAISAPNASLGWWMWGNGSITEDLTADDTNGRYLAVNADFDPGEFYRRTIPGLTAGGTYQVYGWVIDTKPGHHRGADLDTRGAVVQIARWCRC